MTSNWQKTNEATYSTGDLSSTTEELSNNLTVIDLHEPQQSIHDFELREKTLIEEVKEKFPIFLYKFQNLFSVHRGKNNAMNLPCKNKQ